MAVNQSANSTCVLTFKFSTGSLTHLPSSVKPTWTVLLVVNGITAPVTFLMSLSIVWVVLGRESLRSNSSNLLQAAFAFTDLIVGAVRQPTTVCFLTSLLQGYTLPCPLYHAISLVSVFTGLFSLSCLMMVSIERYLAIEYCFLHHVNVTVKRLAILMAVTFFSIPVKIALTTPLDFPLVPFVLIVGKCLLVILYCVVKVHFTARRQLNAISAQAAAVQRTEEERQDQKSQFKEYKRTIGVGILVLTNFIFYIPMLIVMIISWIRNDITEDFQYIAMPIAITCINLQSLVNRLMCLRLSGIRKAVMKKLFRYGVSPIDD